VQLELLDSRSPDVERVWTELDGTSGSFFVSWGWMESWLACLPREHQPRLAVFRDNGRPVSACFLGGRKVQRLGVVSSRALFLNTTGDERLDKLWVEHNGLLGRELGIGQLVDLLPDDWDELFLPGLRAEAFGGLQESVIRGVRVRLERTVPVHVVDLARVREQGYLELLTGQTRAQIRRARREVGALDIEIAEDEASARAIYGELVELHQRQWRARGEPGAWADPFFDRFHRHLINRRFARGEIQLVRVRTGDHTVGCLYNFVHRGRVLQYQSGFASFDNKHIKPGFLAHAAAIEHAAAEGHAVYDFLAGDRRYKRSLATDATSLVWARLQRLRMKFLVEDRVREWVRARRAMRAPRTTERPHQDAP
jgi:hypothetical protein